ncbi:light-chain fibroin [Danaus plexippus plexippus]|uniref:Fibroin light chain n=2 Tax=Danaus plexippus TaxID=13037 RepID=A0A212EQ24_DANPL|nr:light-chain fibroin [Danaus plexippus plexippus]
MLPFVLVFLFAQSTFALPTALVNFVDVNEARPVIDNGQLVSRALIDKVFELIDGADIPLYAQMMIQSVNDQANSGDAASQASAVVLAINAIAELANGIPGDACESAALVNAYAYAVSTGNSAGLRSALVKYVQRINANIDAIVRLVNSPDSVRYSSGPRGNCIGGGRSYQFEEAWDDILNNANPFQIGLLNEEYCAAKRMYNAPSVRSNNLAATVTASLSRYVNQIGQNALGPLAEFLRAAAIGGNLNVSAGNAKAALSRALASVQY